MKKSLLHAGLLLTIVVMMTATTVWAAPANTLKPKKTPIPTGTDVESTEVTPAPRGNSEAHRNNNSNSDRNNQKNFRGLVISSSDTSLTVELKDGSQQVFTLDENTVIKYPTHFIPQPSETATATETATVPATEAPTETPAATATVVAGPLDGLQVMVHAVKQTDGSFLASYVMVIPGKPAKLHHVGVVSAYTEGQSITILAKDGMEYTFQINDMTKLLPEGSTIKVGDTVTVIMPRILSNQPMVAAGIVLHVLEPEMESETGSGD